MARSRSARFSATSLFVLAACLAAPAMAQDAPPAAEEEEILVTGVRESLRDAIEVKRESPLVMEAISSDDIGQLPDVTIAESLVRLPGLNGSRDRGNASQAAIRGLGPRLVLGLVNGREVASSEPDRNIRWEIYPSEVVNGVEVYKAQSANLIAGGVAGTVNIRTLAPLDYEGHSAVLRAGPVYYDGGTDFPNYDPWGNRISGSYVAQISDQFAFVLGASFQDQRNGYPSFQGWGYNDERLGGNPGDLNGDLILDHTPWGMQTEIKMLEEVRTGIMGGAQWRPSSNFELQFDALWSEVTIDEHQNQAWYCANVCGNWGNGNFGAYNAPGSSYTIIGGDVVAATLPFASVNNVIAQYDEDKTLFVTGLNGEWTTGAWTFTGDLSYSEAERDNTWRSVQLPTFPASMSFDTRAGIVPFVTTSSNPADTSIQFAPDWQGGAPRRTGTPHRRIARRRVQRRLRAFARWPHRPRIRRARIDAHQGAQSLPGHAVHGAGRRGDPVESVVELPDRRVHRAADPRRRLRRSVRARVRNGDAGRNPGRSLAGRRRRA